MKHAVVACALLIAGSALVAAPAFADPVMPPPVTDDAPPPAPSATTPAPADDPVFPKPATVSEKPVTAVEKPSVVSDKPASAPPPACADCAPPKRYDSEEVIKKIREIDRSRVINTTERAPAPAPRRSDEGMRVRSDKTLVVFVTHEYRVIESPGLVSAAAYDVAPAPRYSSYRPRRMGCRHGYDRYGHCRGVLHVRD
jgi:hypothetical protein